jgi:uncharacterized repeat protein (TIGR01451 family)
MPFLAIATHLNQIKALWRGFSISVTDLAGTDDVSTDRRKLADRGSEDRPQSRQFESFSMECLKAGLRIRFQARGSSMSPAIRDGETVYVKPASEADLCKGDIVLLKADYGFRLHRLVVADAGRDVFITHGDAGQQPDSPVRSGQILGVAVAKDVRLGRATVRANFKGVGGRFLRVAARGQYTAESVASKLAHMTGIQLPSRPSTPRPIRQGARTLLGLLGLLVILMAAPRALAQVAFDATTSTSGRLAGAGTVTLSFTHTTTATANRLLIVGVSIDVAGSATTGVVGITYNSTALSFIGAHNDAGNTRRVELWSLLNPASGTNLPIVVSVNIPAAVTEGVVAGASTFTGVDQTVPLGTFVSADGAVAGCITSANPTSACNSQVDVPSVVNGMVFDTMATGGTPAVTVPGPQVQQWNISTGTSATQDVTGTGSSRPGAPSVPVSELFSTTSNWSQGAISINPSAADIGVTTAVASAVFLGQNTTYTINIFNNGTSAASGVSLSDTLASGMTLVSATPSTGTCNTSANPIICSIGTLASGANATVTVVETAAASGAFANTATVSDSGTPPDLNPGNNTYVSVATVQAVACATVSQATAGTNLTGVLNTYYPGSANVAAGATSITVGAATGAGTAIASGNLLLVIQMQDASINDSNTVAYGNGFTGQGFTNLNSAGDYEFVTAKSAVGTGGGSVTIVGAGPGGGLVFPYHSAAASASAGQSTFQVIVVPQYTTASFSAATPPSALAWNGSTGGVLAIDASSTLTLNGATVSVSGQGFRGGAGMELNGGGGANTDYQQPAPAAYTGATEAGWDAPKGEGIAGTPAWVQSGTSYLATGTSYPSGTAGTDGSMARGAPGNAGGGGTDGDPQTASPGGNDENAGGGGGGNGGSGGFGGDSWDSNLSTGGEGGAVFPATINRVALGGGGGGGSRNNDDGNNQASGGAAGGGIIVIRANALTGTATLTANGAAAYNGTANDAGGGGGAGGSIVVLSANGGEGGLTLQANGGTGGNAWATQPYTLGNRHGPGGGGGGGVVFVSGAPASVSVAGAASGVTENPGVAYGSTAGAAGASVTNASISSTSGTQSGAQCTPDMTLGKSHIGNFTRGLTASYTVPVSNLSPYGVTSGVVTVNDTLPVGLTPISATGTGWSCSIASQTVSCVDPTPQAANSSYSSITITANVAQTAPATVANTALVSGGGEINLANDSATDVASVVSTADLSLTNAASPNPVAAGGNITYTQVLTNNGPSAADNVVMVEFLPASTGLVSISAPAGWTCNPQSGGGTACTALSMAAGTAATFSMVVKVNTGTPNGTVITGTASASSSVSDPNSTNNTASASTVVGATAGAQMTVTNVASPNPVVAGSNITYTQTATNTGTAAANTPTLTENTPPNTTFQSISAPPGTTCTTPAVGGTGTITCTAASAPAGSSGTVQLIVKVNAGTATGTVITDTVTVNSSNQAFGANSAVATDVVASGTQADLSLSTSATPLLLIAGNDITYAQTVTNNGPVAASGVTFTQAIPANTTFVSVSAPAGWTCTTTTSVTCTDPSLAPGASAAIIVVLNVASSVTAATITTNSSVSATTSDPNSANNSTSVLTDINQLCDLAVTNTGAPSPVTANTNITYTQVVTNTGPSNCAGATFTEAIPTGTTFVSLTPVPAGWTCTTTGSISCTNPSVAPGSTSTFPVIVKVPNGTAGGTIITDTVTVATTTHDTNSANNSATVTIGVSAAADADLSVTDVGTPNPVSIGQNVTFTQTISNGGPHSAANPVTLTETLPTGTTFVSLAGTGWTCTNVAPYKCTSGTIASGNTSTVTFVVTVTSGTTITDNVSVNSATADQNPNNNNATATVQVGTSAALSITNSASPVPVQAGNNITYTQVATNGGPSTAAAASITETTPPNTNFQSIAFPAGWACTTPAVGAAGTITCTNATFAPGTASFTVILAVNAGTAAGTAINNTVTVSSSTADPNSANNTATATDVVALATQADLVTTNSPSVTTIAAGSNVTYTQSVTNKGPAAASGVTFTQTTPPNTNFQSLTSPAGWTCVKPAVGSTGTITCTDLTNLALNATANFTVVLQVAAGTPSGTTIAETATANATNLVPSLTTNSATATVVVANANSADMAIVKTATPSPAVAEGDILTYSLAITNNGPASATNVTVTDPLPSGVTYLSATSTIGTCSQAGGTVTCLLGTMANAATATVTIVTLAGSPGVASNTASVTADQTDPILTNNSSTQSETINAPTNIRLQSFAARLGKDKTGANRTVLFWKTGGEAHNLGFNIYRERSGQRVRVNPSLIAGSALLMSGALPKHSGKTYSWIDSSPSSGSGSYWLEDVDVNGTRTLHGPVTAEAASSSQSASEAVPATALLLNQLNQALPAASSNEGSHAVENTVQESEPTSAQRQKQFELAANPAVKLFVKHEGWHRVTQPELVNAGLNPNVDPALLHLYAEAIERPIQITGASSGPGGFGPQSAIEFYGTGIDTPYSGTRVYWLVAGDGPGQRIKQLPLSTGSNQPPPSYPFAVELTPHTTYFAALITSNGNNFFGSLVSSAPLDQNLRVPHFDKNSTDPAKLEVVLQGVILGIPHDVAIALNGATLGDLTFTGQDKGKFVISLPPGLLLAGENTVTLTAQGGDYDTSLVQSIRIAYPSSYATDTGGLKFSGLPGEELKITGFTSNQIVILDVTDRDQPVELTPQISPEKISSATTSTTSQYSVEVQVPWTTTNPAAPARHALLAVGRVDSVAGIRPNHPSHWHSAQAGSKIVMISPGDFAGALSPLVRAHEAEGKSATVIPVDDLYDEFSFGRHSPYAIRDFLQTATKNWHTPPAYLLLNGRASLDPRNYLGFGHLDFVPTKIVPSSLLMTASDDWFSDFNDTGMPTIPTGRFPVSTADESQLVAGKVAAYEGQSTNGPWTSQALMVADINDTENFTQDTQIVQKQLPASLQVTDVFASTMGAATAQQDILTAINSGQLLVNYSGHGSEDEWSGEDLFDNTAANALTNGSSLPVFLIMNCLNGFFQDVYEQPLAVTLMLAPNGGAVAVLASSGLNQPAPQTTLNKLIVQSAFNPPNPALGDAILKAKAAITDLGVRETFNLLGDPAMQIKPAAKIGTAQ